MFNKPAVASSQHSTACLLENAFNSINATNKSIQDTNSALRQLMEGPIKKFKIQAENNERRSNKNELRSEKNSAEIQQVRLESAVNTQKIFGLQKTFKEQIEVNAGVAALTSIQQRAKEDYRDHEMKKLVEEQKRIQVEIEELKMGKKNKRKVKRSSALGQNWSKKSLKDFLQGVVSCNATKAGKAENIQAVISLVSRTWDPMRLLEEKKAALNRIPGWSASAQSFKNLRQKLLL